MNELGQKRKVARRRPNRRLQELRINAGLSPNDLGRRVGVSGQTIRLAEGGYVPGPRIQFQIAQAFGLRPLDIWPIETQRAAA
jgi:DNA-binding XRE family transcriptional regulator